MMVVNKKREDPQGGPNRWDRFALVIFYVLLLYKAKDEAVTRLTQSAGTAYGLF